MLEPQFKEDTTNNDTPADSQPDIDAWKKL